jgi:hypothetical protein
MAFARNAPVRVVAVVKGTEDALLEAVIKYGGIRVLGYETTTDPEHGDTSTVAVLEVEDVGTLLRWYAHYGGDVVPFPDGSLLYWRFGRQDE